MLKRIVAWVAVLTLTVTPVMAQTPGSVTPRVRVTSAGTRISGRLITVDSDALTITPNGKHDPVRIALSSISTAEVSEGKRSRVGADLAGVGIGFGAAFLTVVIATEINGNCQSFLSNCVGSYGPPPGQTLATLAMGVGAGVVVAHLIGRERWRTVPLGSLASLITPVATPRASAQ
jgi:hypothetical protein